MPTKLDIESAFIASVVEQKALKQALNEKIDETFFFGANNKLAFRWLLNYFRQYGGMPSKKVFCSENKSFEWVSQEEPTAFWIEKLKARKKRAILKDVGEKFWAELQDGNTEKAYSLLKEGIHKVNIELESSSDKDWTKGAIKRAKDIKALKDRQGLLGIPTPWKQFDDLFMGWQDTQLITVFGRPSTGKTFEICLYAYHAWKHGFKPLIISKEMGVPEIEKRLDAMNTKIGHEKLRKGNLSKSERIILFREAKKLSASQVPFYISAEETLEGGGISNVAAKVEEYQPDIVFIDGVYLMDDEEGGKSKTENLYNITRGLKRVARVYKVPIIVTTQAGRGSASVKKNDRLSGVQWSDSFGQDSDVVIELIQTASMKGAKEMLHRVAKQREGMVGDLYTKWDLNLMDFSPINATSEYVESIEIEAQQEAEAL